MKRTRKEAAFDINNLEIIKHRLMIYIQKNIKCKLYSIQVTFSHPSNFYFYTTALLRFIIGSERTPAFRQTQKIFKNRKIEALHDIERSCRRNFLFVIASSRIHSQQGLLIRIHERHRQIFSLIIHARTKTKAISFQQSGDDISRINSSAFHSVRYTESFDWCTFHLLKVLRSLSSRPW